MAMEHDRLLRIGVLGAEPGWSHIPGQWGPLMNPGRGERRRTGMVITHIWDKVRRDAEDVAAEYDIPHVVERYDQMVGQVDGVIHSGMKSAFWAVDLAKPYVEAGVPTFIDRPGAYSVARIRELVDIARRNRAPLMITNNHENTVPVDVLRAQAGLIAPLTGLLADAMNPQDLGRYSQYGAHGLFMLFPVLTGMVRRVRTYTAHQNYTAPVTLMDCRNRDGSSFTATLQRGHNKHRGYVRIFGRNGACEGVVLPPPTYRGDAGRSRQHFLLHFSLHPMTKFESMIRSGEMPQSYEQIVEKVRIFLASFRSLIDGGAVFDVERFDEEWTAPAPHPGYFPDGYFSEG